MTEDSKGRPTCWWHSDIPDYQAYHDEEWGRPVDNDRRLFEKLCLEGFQAGLSWLTIVRKRDAFRNAFLGFDVDKLLQFTDADIDRLCTDSGIVRHRGKIASVVNNPRGPRNSAVSSAVLPHISGPSSRTRIQDRHKSTVKP